MKVPGSGGIWPYGNYADWERKRISQNLAQNKPGAKPGEAEALNEMEKYEKVLVEFFKKIGEGGKISEEDSAMLTGFSVRCSAWLEKYHKDEIIDMEDTPLFYQKINSTAAREAYHKLLLKINDSKLNKDDLETLKHYITNEALCDGANYLSFAIILSWILHYPDNLPEGNKDVEFNLAVAKNEKALEEKHKKEQK